MKSIALLLAVLATPAAAQIYTCKDGGSTVYSAQPCGADARAVTVKPASGPGQKPYEYKYYRRKADELIIGMPAEHAEMMWGTPNHINRTTSAGGVSEQWVYREGRVSKYLYFINGKLRTIQD